MLNLTARPYFENTILPSDEGWRIFIESISKTSFSLSLREGTEETSKFLASITLDRIEKVSNISVEQKTDIINLGYGSTTYVITEFNKTVPHSMYSRVYELLVIQAAFLVYSIFDSNVCCLDVPFKGKNFNKYCEVKGYALSYVEK